MKKDFRTILSVFLPVCLLLLWGAAGCRKNNVSQSSAQPSAQAYRIIALAPNAVEILFELGAGDRVVGVSDFTVDPPEALNRPKVGGVRNPDIETILSLKPDLLILRGEDPKLEILCKEKGIQIWQDPTETLEDIDQTILALGRMTGMEDSAVRLVADLDHRLELVRSRVAGLDRPKVLFTMRSPDRLASITTVSEGSYIHELIVLAGGENVFGDMDMAYPTVSVEAILAKAPDVIIEAFPGLELSDGPDSLLHQWEQAGPIPAVDNGRVVAITDAGVLIPSVQVAEVAETLMGILHPELRDVGSDRDVDKIEANTSGLTKP